MILAGLPATIQFEGTSLVTTAPAATTTSLPILTPGKMTALVPIKQLFPI